MESFTLTARWIFPVDRPPLPRGTITVQGERIVAVESAGIRTADIDFGNAAILPGFVNAHTHLDLSDALGKCPPSPDFTGWLRMVIDHRRRQTPLDVAKAIDIGLAQCRQYGTTLVGDISAGGASWKPLTKSPLRSVVFYELLGLSEQRSKVALEEALAWRNGLGWRRDAIVGLSPHAPFSVHRQLLARSIRLAHEKNLPLAIHLAESQAELELLEHHTGPFVPLLKELGVWNEDGLATLREIQAQIKDKKLVSLVHANYVQMSVPPGAAIIYCPRTHAAFGHSSHPFRDYLSQGATVALGTDSLASNPDLDVLAEARFVHRRHPEVPGKTLLQMTTLNGARALGWDFKSGSLTPGKSADFVVLPLSDEETGDPHLLIFESNLLVNEAYFRGQAISERATIN
jgi:cytosine/adenosine deaminase-related metal-dependent hydrolase